MLRLRLLFLGLSLAAATACGPAATTAHTPSRPPMTPTLLGTSNPPTRAPATATARPDTCVFRTGPTDEAGIYRFDWQNATLTLNTKIGPLIVDGPRTLTPGPRQIILLHTTRFASPANAIINFDVGGSLIDDPLQGVQEVRDAGGTVVSQTLSDPAGDTKGLPAYLDIVRLERSFGYYPNNIVRVYLAGIHTGQFIWTYQSVSVSVAGVTYTEKSYYDNHTELTETDSQGREKTWAGPVTVEGNVVAFPLQIGVDQPVSAATTTSSGGGDLAGPYPQAAMQTIWRAARQRCP